MYKMHPDDIHRRNFNFLVHGKLTPWPKITANDPWAADHGWECLSPYVLASARAQFFNSWPSDGAPLDIESLEAAFERANEAPVNTRLDCKQCGTSLAPDSRIRGLCAHCRQVVNERAIRVANVKNRATVARDIADLEDEIARMKEMMATVLAPTVENVKMVQDHIAENEERIRAVMAARRLARGYAAGGMVGHSLLDNDG